MDEWSDLGHRDIDGQACEGSGRAERERTNQILMRTDVAANRTFYYQSDHQGSVTHVFDSNGVLAESYRYDAFGKPTITTPAA